MARRRIKLIPRSEGDRTPVGELVILGDGGEQVETTYSLERARRVASE